MSNKRATIYFEPDIYKAIRLKAVETDSSVSSVVAEAIKQYLAEDAEDLSAFEQRANEPEISFEKVLKKLKRNGKI